MIILDNLRAEPDLKQVYSRMGFKAGKAGIPDSMLALVDEAVQHGRELLKPTGCYDYRPIRMIPPHRIELDKAFSIESEKVFRWMEGCVGLYLCAVTIGPELDREVVRLSNSGKVTRAFLLNAYGAEAAEALMARLNRVIVNSIKKQRMEATKRYSPGYGDWEIAAQRDLLGTLGAEKIGIRLTEKYIMIPEKSVSAIIGVRDRQEWA